MKSKEYLERVESFPKTKADKFSLTGLQRVFLSSSTLCAVWQWTITVYVIVEILDKGWYLLL